MMHKIPERLEPDFNRKLIAENAKLKRQLDKTVECLSKIATYCPGDFGLPNEASCMAVTCKHCWRQALASIEKEE